MGGCSRQDAMGNRWVAVLDRWLHWVQKTIFLYIGTYVGEVGTFASREVAALLNSGYTV